MRTRAPAFAGIVAVALASAAPQCASAAGGGRDLKIERLGPVQYARSQHTATLLRSSKVLIAGGTGGGANRSEIYDPATRSFLMHAPMTGPRVGHTATLLRDGRVLLLGGRVAVLPTASGELYQPDSARFVATQEMAYARKGHTATLLRDGRVLVAGGHDGSRALALAEIYDPVSGAFQTTGSMTEPRYAHAAALLGDGRVLLAGGSGFDDNALSSVEIFDPRSGRFKSAAVLSHARSEPAIVTLLDGRVLVLGGSNVQKVLEKDYAGEDVVRLVQQPLASVEIYDPARATFDPADALSNTRFEFPNAVALNADGSVIVVSGGSPIVEVFNRATMAFTDVPGRLDSAFSYGTATALPDGSVLVFGPAAWLVRALR